MPVLSRLRSPLSVVLILVLVAFGVLATLPADADQRRRQQQEARQADKLDQAQREEVQKLLALADAAMTGEEAPEAFDVAWHNDFLKAQDQRTYVPFILTLPAEAATRPLAIYLRVVERKGEEADEQRERAPGEYAFEDVYFVELKAAAGEERARLSRAFAVPAGEYDVYVAMRARGEEAERATVLRQPLTVPDYWSEELATSSIIVADRVEPVTRRLSPDEQAERPYTLGSTEIVPALDTSFTKQQELSILFLIYNPELTKDRKPDVEVEYNFYQKTPEGERYFNKTNPQMFNAETLPREFDLAAGHQLVAGQTISLAPFPEGDFRLEIKVADRNSGRALQRDVAFTVTGS